MLSLQRKFADFEKKAAEAHKAGEAAHAASVAKFSAEAKVLPCGFGLKSWGCLFLLSLTITNFQAADAKLTAIAASKTLTVRQKHEQMDAVVKALSKNVHDEIVREMIGEASV